VFSHEHNLLPLSTTQSYALLSADSKAADEVNNKKRLYVCHDMCGAEPCALPVRSSHEGLLDAEIERTWPSTSLKELDPPM
jgi:hypothetical protein